MEFGANFKKIRNSFSYTQKQVADMLKIKQSNISDWENNISRPEYENLIALSKIYGVSIEMLLGLDE